MSPEEARRILLACRPGTTDASDAEVRAALDLADRDPALGDWWREQQAVQAALRERLRELPLPATLKDDILARRNVVKIDAWRSYRLPLIAAAAALMLLCALVFLRPGREPDTFADFRSRMVRMVVREYRMDVTTSAESEIRDFLRAQRGHADFRLPAPLAQVPLFGAGRLTWQGRPVSMICFERQAGVLMYLFVIDRAAFGTAPGAQPEFTDVVRRPTASWSDGGQLYVLATEATVEDLQTLVQ